MKSEEMRMSQVAGVVKSVGSNAPVPVDGHRRWLSPTFPACLCFLTGYRLLEKETNGQKRRVNFKRHFQLGALYSTRRLRFPYCTHGAYAPTNGGCRWTSVAATDLSHPPDFDAWQEIQGLLVT